jgi:hypothetical protein
MSAIRLLPLAERGHRLRADDVAEPGRDIGHATQLSALRGIAQAIRRAVDNRRAVILMMGGHLLKAGLSRYLIDLMRRGLVSHIATNGAVVIHDFELALVGGTSEDVEKWIKQGQFGLWQETSRLNDIIREGVVRGEGLGQAVGRVIETEDFPHRDISLCAAGYRYGVPVTSHVTIGADIIHMMPNCDGAALGQASYTDFLMFAKAVENLEGGVFLNVGSAVTGPEVYLKALSMARNLAHQRGKQIRDFTTAVFDLIDLPANWRDGPPSPSHPLYYFRPWKTILCRTVSDGGRSHYIQGDFVETIPALWHALTSDLPPSTENSP